MKPILCNTGAPPNPFARFASEELGMEAAAPTTLVWLSSTSHTFMTTGQWPDSGELAIKATYPNDGEWKTFSPEEAE